MHPSDDRAERLGLRNDTLKEGSSQLVHTVRESATIDWTLKESVRAAISVKEERLLASYDHLTNGEGDRWT